MVHVEVLIDGPNRPPVGVPVIVRIRDTALQDAPATVVAEARGKVIPSDGPLLTTVDFDVNSPGKGRTVWALVDVDGDGRVSQGDYVTTQSYPIPPSDDARIRIKVKRV